MALVLCFLLAAAALAELFPKPPVQTSDQVDVLERIRVQAKRASEAATPAVLSFLDSSDFRAMLRSCCAPLAQLPSESLLQRYRAEAQAAELAHALPASALRSKIFHDVTLKQLGEMQWFPNELQMAMIQHANMSTGSARVNDVSQREIFGCKAFKGPTPTWSEASSRLIYTAHNMRRLDTGSKAFFGDVTVVFDARRVKDDVVVAPHDTGLFTMICFHPEVATIQINQSNSSGRLNCSAWPKGLAMGTLEYLDHLILPNLAAGANSTATNRTMLDAAYDLFSHSGMGTDYEDVTAIDDAAMSEYLEADILANPRLPEAVKFVIGNFPTLFGTDLGELLQSTAQRLNWPLFWALGDGNPSSSKRPGVHGGQRYRSNQRIADPQLVATNASVSSSAAHSFRAAWLSAAALRHTRNVTAEEVRRWWFSLADQLRVEPVTAAACGQHCVAVEVGTKDCICLEEVVAI